MQTIAIPITKLSVSTKALVDCVKVMSKVVGQNPILPITESLHVIIEKGKAIFTGTNLTTYVFYTIDLDYAGETIKFLLDLGTIKRISKFIDEDNFVLEWDGMSAKISWSDSEIEIKCDENSSDFPAYMPDGKFQSVTIPSDQLNEGLSLCRKTASSDDLRPSMTCIYFDHFDDHLRLVSTDGHSLTAYLTETSFDATPFMVTRHMSEVFAAAYQKNYTETSMGIFEKWVEFTHGPVKIATRNVDEKYPDYQNVLMNESQFLLCVDINTQTLLRKIDLASEISNVISRQVMLLFEIDKVTIKTEDYDYGLSGKFMVATKSSSVDTDLTIGFNSRLLKKMLSMCAPEAGLELTQSNRPAIIKTKSKYSDKVLLLLMPVMLNKYL